MKWFQNLSITGKLVLAFTITGLLTLFLGVFSLGRMSASNARIGEINSNWKYDRLVRDAFDPDLHEVDEELAAHFRLWKANGAASASDEPDMEAADYGSRLRTQ